MHAIAAVLFALAVLHTFSTRHFERLARLRPAHAGLLHLLGEVETVFGLWAMVLLAAMALVEGRAAAVRYVDRCDFGEPLFVFTIMVIAATRPVLEVARRVAFALARQLPLPDTAARYLVVLGVVPLFGSFITEPAAMTLACLLLGEHLLARGASAGLRYTTLAVLFVNISIGGALTPFAAPPVLMVADTWHWDLAFMLSRFGGRVTLAVLANAALATWWHRTELARAQAKPGSPAAGGSTPALPVAASAMATPAAGAPPPAVPWPLTLVHLGFLAGVVLSADHPPLFLGLLLCFLGVVQAYPVHQSPLMLREGLMVSCFLGGLVVLGGQQRWWLQVVLGGLDAPSTFLGATVLTAFTDNAALTYLGSLVPDLPEATRQALVAGALAGGGLTVIANAPNPAGLALLRSHFEDGCVKPLRLLAAALPPTAIAVAALAWT